MKLIRFFRDNPFTMLMFLCVVVLYSAALIGTDPSSKKSVFTVEELKQKEMNVKENLEQHPVLANSLSLVFMGLLLAGIFFDIGLLKKKKRGEPWVHKKLDAVAAPWGPEDVFKALVFVLFLEGLLFLTHYLARRVTGVRIHEDTLIMVMSLVRDFSIIAYIVRLIRKRGGSPFRDLGLKKENALSFVRLGIGAYVAIFPLLVFMLVLLAMGMRLFSFEPQPQEVVEMFLKPSAGPFLVLFSLFVTLLGPVLEEIFFRGFAYPAFRGPFGVKAGILATSFIFAAFHMNVMAAVPVFVLGVFLCYLYEKTGSLIPSISAHVLHNSLMVFLTLGFRHLSA